MSEQVIAKGFEAAFLESWEGWDQLDTCVFGFYDPIFKPSLREKYCRISDVTFVVFDFDKMIVEGYDDGEAPLITLNMALVEV